jgi:uncharacterized protein (TIGR02246 family)
MSPLAFAEDADPRANDRQTIERSVGSYVRAFNVGNAEEVAAHWSTGGVYISRADGERIVGRDAISKGLKALFASEQPPRLSVKVESIRFVSPTVAIEDGTARVTSSDGSTDTSYTAVHVKDKSGWKIDSLRETVLPEPPTAQEQLAQLEWLAGVWVDDSDSATVRTTCRWTANRTFLTRSFSVSVEDRIEIQGTQIIGWNPATKKIQSWVFDSDGGFGTGTWEGNGDRWVITTSNILPDGRKSTRIAVIRKVDDNTFTWKSTARELAGEILPNIEEFAVVRVAENE